MRPIENKIINKDASSRRELFIAATRNEANIVLKLLIITVDSNHVALQA
jgi:hypothetical protein